MTVPNPVGHRHDIIHNRSCRVPAAVCSFPLISAASFFKIQPLNMAFKFIRAWCDVEFSSWKLKMNIIVLQLVGQQPSPEQHRSVLLSIL